MIVRPFKWSDFEGVLEVVNAAAAADHTRRMPEPMLRQALNTFGIETALKFDQTAVARNAKGVVTGFAWWGVETDNGLALRLDGWIHPNWRRRGVGTALLIAAEAFGRDQRYYPEVTLHGRGYQDIAGIAALYRLKGYQEVHRFYSMAMDLNHPQPELALPPGVALRPFQRSDLDALVKAENAIFVGHWGSRPHTAESYSQQMIVLRPHDPDLWTLAWAGDQIIAECICHANLEAGPTDGWVAVVGVDQAWRGRGLGRAILHHGLNKLQRAGFRTAALHVDAENAPAIALYRAVGMAIVRTRLHFSKTIKIALK